MTDQHAVFAKLTDGMTVRLSPWTDWGTAQDLWYAADSVRFDARKGTVMTNVAYFAVRAEDDVDWNGAQFLPTAIWKTIGSGCKDEKAVIRRIGNEHGLEGREGGWIYREGVENPETQGWFSYRRQYLNRGEYVEIGRRFFVNEYRHAIRQFRLEAARARQRPTESISK